MDDFTTVIAALFAIPLMLLIIGLVGGGIRLTLFKEEKIKNSFGSILKTFIIGIIGVVIIATVFNGCNDEDDTQQIWKRD